MNWTDLDDDHPLGIPSSSARLGMERAARAVIRRIFDAVMRNQWEVVHSLYRESRVDGDWFTVAIWAGLPATVRERIRDMENAR